MFYNWIKVICRHVKILDIIPNIIFYALLTADESSVVVIVIASLQQIDKISDLRASLAQVTDTASL